MSHFFFNTYALSAYFYFSSLSNSSLDSCFWWIFYLIYHIFQLPTFNCCYAVTKSFPTLWSHGLQHARFPCPSLSPYFCANSSPLSWSCYPTITSSVTPFYSCPQSFPASGFFQWVHSSQEETKVIGASASVLSMNIQAWFPFTLMSLISLLPQVS